MLTAIVRSLRTGVVTIGYPEQPARVPERFRGAPLPSGGGSFDALPPPSVCPVGAITGDDGQSRYAVDPRSLRVLWPVRGRRTAGRDRNRPGGRAGGPAPGEPHRGGRP